MMTPRPINPEQEGEIPQEQLPPSQSNVPLQHQQMSRRGALGRIFGLGAVAGAASLGITGTPQKADAREGAYEDTEEGKKNKQEVEKANEKYEEAREEHTDNGGGIISGVLYRQLVSGLWEGAGASLAPGIVAGLREGVMLVHELHQNALIDAKKKEIENEIKNPTDENPMPSVQVIDERMKDLEVKLERSADAVAQWTHGGADAVAALLAVMVSISRIPKNLAELDVGGVLGNLAVTVPVMYSIIQKNKQVYVNRSNDPITYKGRNDARKEMIATEKQRLKDGREIAMTNAATSAQQAQAQQAQNQQVTDTNARLAAIEAQNAELARQNAQLAQERDEARRRESMRKFGVDPDAPQNS